ncbi:MAG: hypothetical protein Q7L55_09440, partial [Actinomycetota bacterium]|nr:hypothetical protein [Actinomycetota bacterium]
ELMKETSWFLTLPEGQVPASERDLPAQTEPSMTAKEFLDTGIAATLHMIGGSGNGWVGHEAKEVGNGIAEQ